LSSIADIRGLPVIDRGAVFAVSNSGRMVALDQVTGHRLWQREIGSVETPCVVGDYVFVITTDQQMVALSAKSGGVVWNVQLPRFADTAKEKPIVWTGPVLAGNRLIAASSGGEMLEIDTLSGKTLKTEKLSGEVLLPPVVAGNTLYILHQNGRLSAYR
jgi:outer membrane protein assembly factor BamB